MKKNIVLILSDDQGAWAMHCAGNEDLITPNLDRLAKMGARFTNFFCVPGLFPGKSFHHDGRNAFQSRRSGLAFWRQYEHERLSVYERS